MPCEILPTGDATAILPVSNTSLKPITVIGTPAIRNTFDDACLQQAVNSRMAPGVTELVLNPDAHCGYGAPVGCVLVSPTHVYPGPVGVDIKCSMSLLQLSIPADAIEDRRVRRALIQAICERTPTGAGRGQQSAAKSRRVDETLGRQLMLEGASASVCEQLGIPPHWAERCEDAFHLGHDDTQDALGARLDHHMQDGFFRNRFPGKMKQLGSYGGGNHFGECETVQVGDSDRARRAAEVFGLQDGHVAFLSHCGSRGIGHNLADRQFKSLQARFAQWGIPLPGGDRELVYAPLGTAEADAYLDDMALGANFATVNHMLINALVLEAFQEVLPGATGELVYFISHNIARKEVVDTRV
jgi:tRNA-splicing ligase RtcB